MCDCGWQALTLEIVSPISANGRIRRPSCSGARKARAFWAAAKAPQSTAPVLATRHPSYDFDRGFMAEGNHFAATADLVDWWAIGRAPEACYSHGFVSEGCPSG